MRDTERELGNERCEDACPEVATMKVGMRSFCDTHAAMHLERRRALRAIELVRVAECSCGTQACESCRIIGRIDAAVRAGGDDD